MLGESVRTSGSISADRLDDSSQTVQIAALGKLSWSFNLTPDSM